MQLYFNKRVCAEIVYCALFGDGGIYIYILFIFRDIHCWCRSTYAATVNLEMHASETYYYALTYGLFASWGSKLCLNVVVICLSYFKKYVSPYFTNECTEVTTVHFRMHDTNIINHNIHGAACPENSSGQDKSIHQNEAHMATYLLKYMIT
jgi:hypothetical protein